MPVSPSLQPVRRTLSSRMTELRDNESCSGDHECAVCLDELILRNGSPVVTCGSCQKSLHVRCAMKLQSTDCPNCRARIFDIAPAAAKNVNLSIDIQGLDDLWFDNILMNEKFQKSSTVFEFCMYYNFNFFH